MPTFDPNDPSFVAPGPMQGRIEAWLREHDQPVPAGRAELVRSILESLAVAFAAAVADASRLSGKKVSVIHIVGGGSQNELLCRLIAERSGLPVLAGPVEATALGNVLIQGRAIGAIEGSPRASARPGRARIPPEALRERRRRIARNVHALGATVAEEDATKARRIAHRGRGTPMTTDRRETGTRERADRPGEKAGDATVDDREEVEAAANNELLRAANG